MEPLLLPKDVVSRHLLAKFTRGKTHLADDDANEDGDNEDVDGDGRHAARAVMNASFHVIGACG